MKVSWYGVHYPDGSLRKFTKEQMHAMGEGIKNYCKDKNLEIIKEEEDGVIMIYMGEQARIESKKI